MILSHNKTLLCENPAGAYSSGIPHENTDPTSAEAWEPFRSSVYIQASMVSGQTRYLWYFFSTLASVQGLGEAVTQLMARPGGGGQLIRQTGPWDDPCDWVITRTHRVLQECREGVPSLVRHGNLLGVDNAKSASWKLVRHSTCKEGEKVFQKRGTHEQRLWANMFV